jgi:hypothetical protein
MERSWKGRQLAGNPLPQFRRRDLASPPWCYLLWGVPAVLAVTADVALNNSLLSVNQAGAFWTVSVAWAGVGCLINARSCGRTHCMIDGVALPALSAVGVLILLIGVPITWSEFWIAFILILVVSFAFEGIRGKYTPRS